MKAKLTAACLAVLAALATPALANDFLSQLSRTDGNALGEHSRPEPAGQAARITPEHIAFLQELARTDGSAAVPAETPPETAVASR